MKNKMILIMAFAALLMLTGCRISRNDDGIIRTAWSHTYEGYPVVYTTQDVSEQGLLAAYNLLEASDSENIIIKISETETDADFDWSALIGELSRTLDAPVLVENDLKEASSKYDTIIILSHFRSNEKTGFNGAVKQTAACSASPAAGKCLWDSKEGLEQLAEYGKRTMEFWNGHILYINVMDDLSIGNGTQPSPSHDIGILSSYDPVALDQACVDLLGMTSGGEPLAAYIEAHNGGYTLIHAEKIGLGSRTYALTVAGD